jgi:hypothetical protein
MASSLIIDIKDVVLSRAPHLFFETNYFRYLIHERGDYLPANYQEHRSQQDDDDKQHDCQSKTLAGSHMSDIVKAAQLPALPWRPGWLGRFGWLGRLGLFGFFWFRRFLFFLKRSLVTQIIKHKSPHQQGCGAQQIKLLPVMEKYIT